MTVRIYRNTDFGATQVDNSIGKLVELLDACLVDGYGDQSITITSAGNVATITTASPHGLLTYGKYDVLNATESDYNGTHSVDVVDAYTLTYNILNSPSSPATGTITGRMGGAGWSKQFSDTNKSVYHQGNSSGSFHVDDTNTIYAKCRGYESMDSIDSGTVPYPTTSDNYWLKSSTSTIRDWVILADENTITYWIGVQGTVDTSAIHHFGDFNSYMVGDIYNKIIMGGAGTGYSNNAFRTFSSINTFSAGSDVNRGWLKSPYSQGIGRISNSWIGNGCGAGKLPYPTERDNALYTDKIYLNEYKTSQIIGEMRGLINPLHARPLGHLNIFDGIGELLGRKFLVINFYSQSQVFLEISDTW